MSKVEYVSDVKNMESSWFDQNLSNRSKVLKDVRWDLVMLDHLLSETSMKGNFPSGKLRLRRRRTGVHMPRHETSQWVRKETKAYDRFEHLRASSSTSSASAFLPVPNDLTTLFADLTKNRGELIVTEYRVIHESLSKEILDNDMLDRLDNIQLLFGLAKRGYSKPTLNYEVFSDIQNDVIEVRRALKKRDFKAASSLSTGLLETFELMSDTLRELRKAGLDLAPIEDTGQTIGGMRIFRIQS